MFRVFETGGYQGCKSDFAGKDIKTQKETIPVKRLWKKYLFLVSPGKYFLF